ncbi:hypothetical protein GCM10007989_33120 [Devosia pacifica]|uniref:Uncharacterized protein n=1 Tax=Devosia pacifica TaxID=1335967 RepID=A0A918VVX2_9HYPH|nr:hypothetical protein [Devosia pacifica]GHA34639.1 hypothetical protein GCM10007989_33120 [Devosia pacifica]
MSETAIGPRRVMLLLAGFIVWSGSFVGLYTLQALGCRFGWHTITVGLFDLHRILLVAGFVVAIAVQVATLLLIWRARGGPQPQPFLQQTGLWAATAALGAAVLVYAPTLFISACT